MECKNFQKHLIFYLEETIAPEKKSLFDEHVKNCSHCSLLLSEFSGIWDRMSEPGQEELSPYFSTKLMNRITEYEKTSVFSFTTLGNKILKPVFIGAVCILGIFLGYNLGSFSSDIQSPPLTSEISETHYTETYLSLFNDIPEGTFADLYFTVINEK